MAKKSKPKVLISDEMSPLAAECFKQAGIEVDIKTGLDKEGLRAIIGEYDGLAVRSSSKVTSKVLEAAGNLSGPLDAGKPCFCAEARAKRQTMGLLAPPVIGMTSPARKP